nr:hypothetical protein [Tanacetum cinerariifolium]
MPPLVHRVTTRMYIRAQTLVLLPSDTKVARLLAMPTPPPSPLPQIPSSPLPLMLSRLLVSPPLPVSPPPLPANPTYPLGYRAAMIRLRPETPSASHLLPLSTPPSGTPPLLPIPVPTSSPPMLFPSTVCRVGTSEVTLPPQKRLYTAMGLRYEVGESLSAPTTRPTGGFRTDYGFVATLDDEIRREPVTKETELGQRLTNSVTKVRQDTNEIYVRLNDAQDDRMLMSGRLNTLFRDRRDHARTALLMEREARLSQEA